MIQILLKLLFKKSKQYHVILARKKRIVLIHVE
jgi:hypothetical protein